MIRLLQLRSALRKLAPSVYGGAIFAGLMLMSGCVVGPRYSRPSAPVPTAYKETPPNWKPAQPADQTLKGKWWEIYQDPEPNAPAEKIEI